MTGLDTITYQVLTQSGTALDDLISGRAEYCLTPDGFNNTQACVVFRPEGGDSDRFGVPRYERSYLFECYGGDAPDGEWYGATAVYNALHDLWHNNGGITVAAGVLAGGFLEQAGIPLIHPITGYKYFQCRMGGKFRSL